MLQIYGEISHENADLLNSPANLQIQRTLAYASSIVNKLKIDISYIGF